MVVMVRCSSQSTRVLTSAALLIAFAVVPFAKCFADMSQSAVGMACCAEMDRDCGHASIQQGCCAVNAPDHGRPAISSRVDDVKPQAVAVLAMNAVRQTPLQLQLPLDSDTAPTRLRRPTYLLISAFRI
jgi:hypothetical protein